MTAAQVTKIALAIDRDRNRIRQRRPLSSNTREGMMVYDKLSVGPHRDDGGVQTGGGYLNTIGA